jgi:hypothetical protein
MSKETLAPAATMVEVSKPGAKTNIAIQPYLDGTENMGLEKYGQVLHEGTTQSEELGALETNGIVRYITGLNEFAPEITAITDKKIKDAKIKQIREDVIHLEKTLAGNVLKIDDPDFWDKVQAVHPVRNAETWKKIILKLHNGSIFLDIKNNPWDLIKLRAIEAGGFSLVAPSYEIARRTGKFKWFLDRFEKTISDKTELIKITNKAISVLTNLFETDVDKLRYVMKVIVSDCAQYKPSTPPDLLLEEANRYITGNGEERSSKKASQTFLKVCEGKLEDLKLIAIIKDANIYQYIVTKGDGKLHHQKSSRMIGGNIQECVEFLKNPLEEKILFDLQESVEREWSK